MPNVSALVQQMHETLSQVHEVIASLDTKTHDEKLDALEAQRDNLVAQLEAAFQKEAEQLVARRQSEREEIAEKRRREDEEIAARRKREDEQLSVRDQGEDEEREKKLEGERKGVEEEVEGKMDEVEEEARKMLEEGHKRIMQLEEKRREINRMIDEEMKAPLPPPPTRKRRGTTRSLQRGPGPATESAPPQQTNGVPESQEQDVKPAAESNGTRGMDSEDSKPAETTEEQPSVKDHEPQEETAAAEEAAPEEKVSEDKAAPEETAPEEKVSEDKATADETVPEEKISEEKAAEEKSPEEKSQEEKPQQENSLDGKPHEDKSQESQPPPEESQPHNEESQDQPEEKESQSQPEESQAQHEESKSREIQPQEEESQPQLGESQPQEEESKSREIQPQNEESQPQLGESQPQDEESKSREIEPQEEESQPQPEETQAQPEKTQSEAIQPEETDTSKTQTEESQPQLEEEQQHHKESKSQIEESQAQEGEHQSHGIQPQDGKSEEHKSQDHQPQESQSVQQPIDSADAGEKTETPGADSGHQEESTRDVQLEGAEKKQDSAAAESTKGDEEPTRDGQTETSDAAESTQDSVRDATGSHGLNSSEEEPARTDEAPQKASESVGHEQEPESAHHDVVVDSAPVHDREIVHDAGETGAEAEPAENTSSSQEQPEKEAEESKASAGQQDTTTGVAPGGAAEEYLKMAEPKESSQPDSSESNEKDQDTAKSEEPAQASSEEQAAQTPGKDSSSTAEPATQSLAASDARNDTAESGMSHNAEDLPTISSEHDKGVQSETGKDTADSAKRPEAGHEASTSAENNDSSEIAAQGIEQEEPVASQDAVTEQREDMQKDIVGTTAEPVSHDQSATKPSEEASEEQQPVTQLPSEETLDTKEDGSADAVPAEQASVQQHEDSHGASQSPVAQQEESHTAPKADSQETATQDRSLDSMPGESAQETTRPAHSDSQDPQSESSAVKDEPDQTSPEPTSGDKEGDDLGHDSSGSNPAGSQGLDDSTAPTAQDHREQPSVDLTPVEQPATSESSLHPLSGSKAVSQEEKSEEVLEGSGNEMSAPRETDGSGHESADHQAGETSNLSEKEPTLTLGTMAQEVDTSDTSEQVNKGPEEGLTGSDEKHTEADSAKVEKPAETGTDQQDDGSKKDNDSLREPHQDTEKSDSAPEKVSKDLDSQHRGEVEQTHSQDVGDPAESSEEKKEQPAVPDLRNQETAPQDREVSDKLEDSANAPLAASSPPTDAVGSSPSKQDDESHAIGAAQEETASDAGSKPKEDVPTISLNGKETNDSDARLESDPVESHQDASARELSLSDSEKSQSIEKPVDKSDLTTHPASQEDGKPKINTADSRSRDDDADEGLFAVPPTPRSEIDHTEPSRLRDDSPEDSDGSRASVPLAPEMSRDVNEDKPSDHGHEAGTEHVQKTDSSVEDQVVKSPQTKPHEGSDEHEASQTENREHHEGNPPSSQFGNDRTDDNDESLKASAAPHAEDDRANSKSVDVDTEQAPTQDEHVAVEPEKSHGSAAPVEVTPRETGDAEVTVSSSGQGIGHGETDDGHQHGGLWDDGAVGHAEDHKPQWTDEADSTTASAGHDVKSREVDDHTHQGLHDGLHEEAQASYAEPSQASWDEEETDGHDSHEDPFALASHQTTSYASGANYEGDGYGSSPLEDQGHGFSKTFAQDPHRSDSHVPPFDHSQTEQHRGFEAPSPAGYSYGHGQAHAESPAIPRSTESAVPDFGRQPVDSPNTPGLFPSALAQVPDESAHTVQGTDDLFDDDDDEDDDDEVNDSGSDYGEAVIHQPERTVYQAQGDESNVALGGNHSSTSIDRSPIRSQGSSWGHRSSGSRGSIGSIRQMTPVRPTDGAYVSSPSLVRADWAAEFEEELRPSSARTTPYMLPSSTYDHPEIAPFSLRNTSMIGGGGGGGGAALDDLPPTEAPGLSSSRWNPERPQTPPSATRDPVVSSSPYSSHTPASATSSTKLSSSNPFRAAVVQQQQQQQQQLEQEQEQDPERQTPERAAEPQPDLEPSLFMPRDVTNVPWHARNDSVPFSLHSQTTLSSNPSSPIHTSLPVDRHEPVIRDSWPPNPAPGYQPYMSSWTGGRQRGDSSLSNTGLGSDYDPFKHDGTGNYSGYGNGYGTGNGSGNGNGNGHGNGHGNGNGNGNGNSNRGSLYNPFAQRSRATSAVSAAPSNPSNPSASNSPSRGNMLFQKMRSVFDQPAGGGNETGQSTSGAAASPPRRVSGVFHSASPQRMSASERYARAMGGPPQQGQPGQPGQQQLDEGYEHPNDRRGGYLNEAEDEIDERSAFLRSSGLPSGAGGGVGYGRNDDDDDDVGRY